VHIEAPPRPLTSPPIDTFLPGVRFAERFELEGIDTLSRTHVSYRARDHVLERTVCLRMLREQDQDRSRRAALRRQARVQSALRHPNIVTVFDYAEDNKFNACAIVEEYIGSNTLETWLIDSRTRQHLSLVCRHFLLPICSAIAFAHRFGVLHRNLKPSKILLDCYDDPKVAEFGLLNSAPSSHVLGTLEYLAPEQIDNPRLADVAGDIYALGVMFYELIGGELPFTGRNDLELASNILNLNPRPLVELAPDAPAGLDAIVLRCLEKQPQHRFPSADALLLALREVLSGTRAP
jgi:serine/threonine-protein kinase